MLINWPVFYFFFVMGSDFVKDKRLKRSMAHNSSGRTRVDISL